MTCHRLTSALMLMILCISDLYAEFDGSFINNVTDHYATPHLEWKTNRAPLNIFFLSTRYGARDIVELGQRFPVKRTVFLMERPRRKAVHYDESRIMEIRRLAGGAYDLIVIARGDFTMLPPDVQYTILDKIRNGTGLLLIGGRLPYRKLFEHRLPAPLFLRETVWTENFKPRRVSAFAFGKGRILHLPWNGEGLTPDFMPGRCWMANYENAMLILMRSAWWAAGQDSEQKYQVRKTMDSWQIVPPQKVSYRWRDEENHILGSGTSAEGVIPVPQGVPAGKYFCDRIMEGALPAFGEERVQSPLGAVSVTLESQFLRRDQAIKGTIRLSQKALSDYSAVLELSDALNGNIWERKTIHIPAGSAEREFCIADYYPPELGG